MRIPITLRIPALGDLEAVGEVEVPEEILATATPRDTLTDADLCKRWNCSPRTTRRLRDERRLTFSQPTPRVFVYRVADVERVEADTRHDGVRHVASKT